MMVYDYRQLIGFAAGVAAGVAICQTVQAWTDKSGASFSPPLPPPGREQDPIFLPFADAKDVATPYGNLRNYRLGPVEADRKVLLLHGISTPSIAFKALANALASRGARVLVFDLPCRGGSGGPADLPYDGRLYASLILMALASDNKADWSKFSIVGYSLGGGLAMDFTYWFPQLVEDIALIAPSGLLREKHVSLWSRLVYRSGLIRGEMRKRLIRQRLRITQTKTMEDGTDDFRSSSKPNSTAVDYEMPQQQPPLSTPSPAAPSTQIARAVNYQVDHSHGFIDAFISTLLYAPIYTQQNRWRSIGEKLTARRIEKNTTESQHLRNGLNCGKVILALGREDPIILAEEVIPDAQDALGTDNVHVLLYDSGHDVGITYGREIADDVWDVWTSTESASDKNRDEARHLQISST
ncbi:MAG: hypothetical protein M1828_001036, partial [Chrysothrix sp. TS-e1954]